MRDARLWATVFIWIAITIIVTTLGGMLLASSTNPAWWVAAAVLLILLTVIAMGGISTQAMWTGSAGQDHAPASSAKAKRVSRDRIERLVEGLDDDEVYELEALLLREHDSLPQRERHPNA